MTLEKFKELVAEFGDMNEYGNGWTANWDGMEPREDIGHFSVDMTFAFNSDEFTVPVCENTGEVGSIYGTPPALLLSVADGDMYIEADMEGLFSFIAFELLMERRKLASETQRREDYATRHPEQANAEAKSTALDVLEVPEKWKPLVGEAVDCMVKLALARKGMSGIRIFPVFDSLAGGES